MYIKCTTEGKKMKEKEIRILKEECHRQCFKDFVFPTSGPGPVGIEMPIFEIGVDRRERIEKKWSNLIRKVRD